MYLLLIIRVVIITLEIKFVLFMLTFLPVSQSGGSSCVAAAGWAAANWRQRPGGGWLGGRQPAPAAVKTTQFCVSLKLSLLVSALL